MGGVGHHTTLEETVKLIKCSAGNPKHSVHSTHIQTNQRSLQNHPNSFRDSYYSHVVTANQPFHIYQILRESKIHWHIQCECNLELYTVHCIGAPVKKNRAAFSELYITQLKKDCKIQVHIIKTYGLPTCTQHSMTYVTSFFVFGFPSHTHF